MPRRILLVDDQYAGLSWASEVLRRGGAVVDTARTISEARDLLALSGATYDAIVTDKDLDDGSGLDLLRSTLCKLIPRRVLATAEKTTMDYVVTHRKEGIAILGKPYGSGALIAITGMEIKTGPKVEEKPKKDL